MAKNKNNIEKKQTSGCLYKNPDRPGLFWPGRAVDRPGQAYQNRLWAHSVGPRQSAWASCDLEIACRTKPKVWRHVQSLLQLWCPEQVGSKKNKHFPLVSKRTAGPRLQADSDRQHVQTLPVETWALLEEKNTTPLFTARGIAIKFFFFSAGRRSGSGFVLRHDLFAALGREKKRRLRRGFASWSCCFNQSGLIAGFWRPGGACLCIYKDVLTWSSVLVLTLDCPPNSSQLLLPPARFALLLSVCYQPEKQKQKTKAEATKWRGQSVKRFARIVW